ncbi:hypothetical protein MGS_06117 [Candida albicans P78042]|nr:hypothetical protein MGK_06105 [Candida albicans P57055]KHC64311.1 hypothetical protein MGS_06117 [Candida albicans P78042]RLP67215.1 hypothetical protein L150_06012 [Candida albicans Ca529L]
MTQNEYWCWSATVATIYVFIDDSYHLHCIEIGCRLTVSTEHLVIIKQCVAPFFFTLKNVLLKEKIGAVECCCIFFCFFSSFFFLHSLQKHYQRTNFRSIIT